MDLHVAIPAPISGVEKPLYAVLREKMTNLLIGASFFQPAYERSQELYIRNAIWRLASTRMTDKKFVTRKLFEPDGKGVDTYGIRTWRTE